MTNQSRGHGMLALVGGGEFEAGCTPFDKELLAASGGTEVVVIPAAAAFENPAAIVATPAFRFVGSCVAPQTMRMIPMVSFVMSARQSMTAYRFHDCFSKHSIAASRAGTANVSG